MIREIAENIDKEIKIAREMSNYIDKTSKSSATEEKIINEAINSLGKKVKIINRSIPYLLNNISLAKKLPAKSFDTGLEKVKIGSANGEYNITIKKEDKKRYISELNISEALLKKLKRKQKKPEAPDDIGEFKSPRGYLKYANKWFLDYSRQLTAKGYFKSLAPEIRKANLDILFPTYVAMMFFSTMLSFFAGIIIFLFLMIFDIGITFPIIGIFEGSYLLRFAKLFWIPIVLPGLTFLAVYIYPGTERSTIERRINQELPFAVVHMSAISGSGIEPTKIFRIIGLSKEYKYLGREIRKILNQINVYGYDLVTALNNISKVSPSAKAAELFAGLSTTISSGGDLTNFFEKRAESLLIDYRLEREKFTKIAETFMDIYISVVIATPMILLLLLIMISVSGIQIGFSPNQITMLIIFAVGIINLIFIGVLHVKQPAY